MRLARVVRRAQAQASSSSSSSSSAASPPPSLEERGRGGEALRRIDAFVSPGLNCCGAPLLVSVTVSQGAAAGGGEENVSSSEAVVVEEALAAAFPGSRVEMVGVGAPSAAAAVAPSSSAPSAAVPAPGAPWLLPLLGVGDNSGRVAVLSAQGIARYLVVDATPPVSPPPPPPSPSRSSLSAVVALAAAVTLSVAAVPPPSPGVYLVLIDHCDRSNCPPKVTLAVHGSNGGEGGREEKAAAALVEAAVSSVILPREDEKNEMT